MNEALIAIVCVLIGGVFGFFLAAIFIVGGGSDRDAERRRGRR